MMNCTPASVLTRSYRPADLEKRPAGRELLVSHTETGAKEPGSSPRGVSNRLGPGTVSGPRVARTQEASGCRRHRRDSSSGPVRTASLLSLGDPGASCRATPTGLARSQRDSLQIAYFS